MTGHNTHHGYRYTMTAETRTSALHEDWEVGALDAPSCIPAGSHIREEYWPRPMYRVARRKDGLSASIHTAEWRTN